MENKLKEIVENSFHDYWYDTDEAVKQLLLLIDDERAKARLEGYKESARAEHKEVQKTMERCLACDGRGWTLNKEYVCRRCDGVGSVVKNSQEK